jgi:hypothetical protein
VGLGCVFVTELVYLECSMSHVPLSTYVSVTAQLILTQLNTVILEKLIVAQPVKGIRILLWNTRIHYPFARACPYPKLENSGQHPFTLFLYLKYILMLSLVYA